MSAHLLAPVGKASCDVFRTPSVARAVAERRTFVKASRAPPAAGSLGSNAQKDT